MTTVQQSDSVGASANGLGIESSGYRGPLNPESETLNRKPSSVLTRAPSGCTYFGDGL